MDEQKKLAFEFAKESTKQIITLSTAIIAISVTFSKDIFNDPNIIQKGLLIGSWIMFLVSVVFGVFTLLALTGTLDPKPKIKQHESNEQEGNGFSLPSIYDDNITNLSKIQILAFLSANVLTVFYGVAALVFN